MSKKFIINLILISFICVLFSSCGLSRIETLTSWSFQYNEGTNDYSLFFGFLDSTETYRSAPATVDIEIVNDNGETVYENTIEVTENYFGNYHNNISGEHYLADVRIEASDIKEGTSQDGKVYLTVTGENFAFDEVNCDALNCLPVLGIDLTIDELPVEVSQSSSFFGVESKIRIDDVQYSYSNTYTGTVLTVEFTGEKTYSGNYNYSDIISYKLFDSNDYLIDSGNAYLESELGVGDKFKDTIEFYDLTPGESYYLQFANYKL